MAEIHHLPTRMGEAGALHLMGLLRDAAENRVDLGPRGPHIMALVQSLDELAGKLRKAHGELLSLPGRRSKSTAAMLLLGSEVGDLLDSLLAIARDRFSGLPPGPSYDFNSDRRNGLVTSSPTDEAESPEKG